MALSSATTALLPQITTAATNAGVPPSLLASLVNQESGGNPLAMGAAGEVGLTQIKPTTAFSIGGDPYSTSGNLAAGAGYLSQLYQRYGTWTQALSAYNAGPSNVNSAAGQSYASAVLANAGITDTSSASAATDNSNQVAQQTITNQNEANTAAATGSATAGGSSTPSPIISTLPSALQAPAAAAKSGIPSAIMFVIGLSLAVFGAKELVA